VELAKSRRDGTSTLAVPLLTERESVDLANIKLRNMDYDRFSTGNRGGVDDLIQLTHLHEPAILDVLSQRYARDCIYSACGGNSGTAAWGGGTLCADRQISARPALTHTCSPVAHISPFAPVQPPAAPS
jgi:hypothetical protein